MKTIYPKITACIESVTPAKAAEWLASMGRNRNVKEPSVAMYANDMVNGNWKISPQGIAFDEAGTLFDGQHRLRAVVRAGLAVPMLVLRGFPVEQGKMKTMDVVDCGVLRSLPDRLKLMGCYAGNPNLMCATARALAIFLMHRARAARRISLSTTLDIIAIWNAEFTQVMPVFDKANFKPARNATVAAAFVISAAVNLPLTLESLARLTSGANLAEGSALLELRNSLINGTMESGTLRTGLCLTALLCQQHSIPGAKIYKPANQEKAEKYFREKQSSKVLALTNYFLVKTGNEKPAQ